ncbi:MAG TPA: metallophosphoesterase family protein [Aggregatilineales bacterium]|nr:metallophosphoesterase family protein [Anaerolineales bacterium]HRE47036.1 metallophosphoesterase family protein [Aggregatilineales bacterium]
MPDPTYIGIISDTHMPQRWNRLHESLTEIFRGVNLILHAGDVGELWVLDELSRIAPVVAVHGNDETAAAQAALPFMQTLVIAGHRLILTHGHLPDLAEEYARRKVDTWDSKLADLVTMAHPHGAEIVVYGHLHIPMHYCYDNVWLVNGGGIASGGFFHRQKVQSVAVMTLSPAAPPAVTHYDLNSGKVHAPPTAYNGSFKEIWNDYNEPLFDPMLIPAIEWLRQRLVPLVGLEYLREALLPLGQACWWGGKESMTAQEILDAFRTHPDTPPILWTTLRELPAFAPYL